ncbi:MAG: tetratricopeptide repeat protein, partial [Rhodothermia bacterium]
EAAFERALELNPDLISALSDISTYYTDSGRTNDAYDLAQRAIEINPNKAMGHFARGYVLRYTGMMEESEWEMRIAMDLDSTNVRFRSAGLTLMANEQFEDARKAFAIDKPSTYYAWTTALSYLRQGKSEDAARILESADGLDQDGLPSARVRALRAYLSGEFEKGLLVTRTVEAAELLDGETNYFNAILFCVNGGSDGCLRNLDRAVENGYFNYPNFKSDPLLDLVRGTPEFERVLEMSRQKHERFKAKYFLEQGR